MKRQFKFTVEEILEIMGNHLRTIGEIDDGRIYIEVNYDHVKDGHNITVTGMTFTVEERPEPAPLIKLVQK